MSLLTSIKNRFRSAQTETPIGHETVADIPVVDPGSLEPDDFRAWAEVSKQAADDAMDAKNYEEAWQLYQEQRCYLLQWSNQIANSRGDTAKVEAAVFEDLASVLRQKQRHREAMAHIVYWTIVGANEPLKRHENKLKAFFRRCQYENYTLEDVQAYVQSQHWSKPFSKIQNDVAQWN